MRKIPPKLLSLVLCVLPCIAHAQVSMTLIIHNQTVAVGCDRECTNPIYRCTLAGDTACFGGSMTVDSNAAPGDYFYGLYTPDGSNGQVQPSTARRGVANRRIFDI